MYRSMPELGIYKPGRASNLTLTELQEKSNYLGGVLRGTHFREKLHPLGGKEVQIRNQTGWSLDFRAVVYFCWVDW